MNNKTIWLINLFSGMAKVDYRGYFENISPETQNFPNFTPRNGQAGYKFTKNQQKLQDKRQLVNNSYDFRKIRRFIPSNSLTPRVKNLGHPCLLLLK